MSANGISTLPTKAARVAAKLALAQASRAHAVPVIVSGSSTWTFLVFEPTSFFPEVAVKDWKVSTTYALNDYVKVPSNGWFFKCTVAGTTAAAEPVWTDYFDYRPLHTLDAPQVTPPRATPLPLGRPWK